MEHINRILNPICWWIKLLYIYSTHSYSSVLVLNEIQKFVCRVLYQFKYIFTFRFLVCLSVQESDSIVKSRAKDRKSNPTAYKKGGVPNMVRIQSSYLLK